MNYLMCMILSAYIHAVHACTACMHDALGGQKRTLGVLEQTIVSYCVGAGNETRWLRAAEPSSERGQL